MPRDRVLAALFLVVSAALVAAMPGWRSADPPPAYAMPIAEFIAWQQSVAASGTDSADVPVLAQRFGFTPALELRAGQTYRLHLATVDVVHSATLAGREILLTPGTVQVITITPRLGEALVLQCGEYCGLGHSRMRAAIQVAK